MEFVTSGLPLLSDKIAAAMKTPFIAGLFNITNNMLEGINGLLGAYQSLSATRLSNMQTEHAEEMSNLRKEFEAKKKYGSKDADYQNYLVEKQAKAEAVLKEEQDAKERALKEKQKKMSIAQAYINGALAITNILANSSPLLWAFMIPMTIATTAIQVAAIEEQKFAKGGYVQGPGTSTSDSVRARLSVGEFVIPARQVQELGGESGVNEFLKFSLKKQKDSYSFSTGRQDTPRMSQRIVYPTESRNSSININIDTMVGDKRFTNNLIDGIRKELPRRL
jgi:hypothetical protein